MTIRQLEDHCKTTERLLPLYTHTKGAVTKERKTILRSKKDNRKICASSFS